MDYGVVMNTSASLVPKGINEASFTQSQLPFILEATETISFAGGEHSPMCSLSAQANINRARYQSCPLSLEVATRTVLLAVYLNKRLLALNRTRGPRFWREE